MKREIDLLHWDRKWSYLRIMIMVAYAHDQVHTTHTNLNRLINTPKRCKKIMQRNTNRTASQKSTFKIYILYIYLYSIWSNIVFDCFISSLFCVHAANDNFTVHKIISSLNDRDIFPVYPHSVSNLWREQSLMR